MENEKANTEMTPEMTAKALAQYKKHLEHLKNYRTTHKKEMDDYMKKRYHRIKEENPAAHRQMLDKKKEKRLLKLAEKNKNL